MIGEPLPPVEQPAPPPDPALQVAATEAVAKAEAAATRRRWINLGEFVAIAGLIIAAVGLYLNWADRRADEAGKHVAEAKAAREEARFDVRGVASSDGTSLVIQHDDRHPIRDATVTFPSDLGIGTKDTIADSIDRDWFAEPLLKKTASSAGRMPVLIALTYWDGDTPRTTRGIYDIGWRTVSRPILGRLLKLESLRLREVGGTQRRLDSIWAAERPKPKG